MDGEADVSVPLSDDSGRRRKVHGMLKLYYGLNEEGKSPEQPESLDPCDINGPHFDPEHYLNKVRNSCRVNCLQYHSHTVGSAVFAQCVGVFTLLYAVAE